MYPNDIRLVECSVNGDKAKSQVWEGNHSGNGKEFLALFQAFLTPVRNAECFPISSLPMDYCPENDERKTVVEQGDDFCLENPGKTSGEKDLEFITGIVAGDTGLVNCLYPGEELPKNASQRNPVFSLQRSPDVSYLSYSGEADPASLGKVHYQGAAITQEPQTMQITADKAADSFQPVLNGFSEFNEACPGISLPKGKSVPGEKAAVVQGDDGINSLPYIKETGSLIQQRLFPRVSGEPILIKETGFLKDLGAVDQQTAKKDLHSGPGLNEEVQPEINLVTGEVPEKESGNRITMDRLPAKIRTFLNNGEETSRPRTLELQLEPETLGTVKVTVNWTKGRISAEFLAQTDSAAAALNSGLETLKESLSRLQINIAGLSVAVAGQLGKETGGSQLPVPKRERSRVERGRSPEQVNHLSTVFHPGTSSVNCLI